MPKPPAPATPAPAKAPLQAAAPAHLLRRVTGSLVEVLDLGGRGVTTTRDKPFAVHDAKAAANLVLDGTGRFEAATPELQEIVAKEQARREEAAAEKAKLEPAGPGEA